MKRLLHRYCMHRIKEEQVPHSLYVLAPRWEERRHHHGGSSRNDADRKQWRCIHLVSLLYLTIYKMKQLCKHVEIITCCNAKQEREIGPKISKINSRMLAVPCNMLRVGGSEIFWELNFFTGHEEVVSMYSYILDTCDLECLKSSRVGGGSWGEGWSLQSGLHFLWKTRDVSENRENVKPQWALSAPCAHIVFVCCKSLLPNRLTRFLKKKKNT